VARLPGQVATCRADFEHLLVPDLHGAGFRATRLADVPDGCAGDRHDPRGAGFAVIGGNRGGALEGLTIRVSARRTLEDDVAPGHPTDMKPPIVWPGHTEAQVVIVSVRATDQDLPPAWQRVRDQASLLVVRR
jgi:hypothetical protein